MILENPVHVSRLVIVFSCSWSSVMVKTDPTEDEVTDFS